MTSNLKYWRKKAGLTLRELGKQTGVHFSHLFDLETGRTNEPRLGIARKLAKFFGVSVDDLFPDPLEKGFPITGVILREASEIINGKGN